VFSKKEGGREGGREGKEKRRTEFFLEHLANHICLRREGDDGHVDPFSACFEDEGGKEGADVRAEFFGFPRPATTCGC